MPIITLNGELLQGNSSTTILPSDPKNPPKSPYENPSAITEYVMIIFIDGQEQKVHLIKQTGDVKHIKDTINAPGGKIKPNETPLQAAERELLEETGMSTGRTLTKIHEFGNPLTHIIHVFAVVLRPYDLWIFERNKADDLDKTKPAWYKIREVMNFSNKNFNPELRWLIAMALDPRYTTGNSTVKLTTK